MNSFWLRSNLIDKYQRVSNLQQMNSKKSVKKKRLPIDFRKCLILQHFFPNRKKLSYTIDERF